MTPHDIAALIAVEYDLVRADSAIGSLLELVSKLPLSEAQGAFDDLYIARLRVRRALTRLDPAISDAVAEHERTAEPAPF